MGIKQKFFENNQFKSLQVQWYRKLTSEGFEDAERLVNGELLLYQCSLDSPYRHSSPISRETRLEYFLHLSHKAEQEDFKSNRDRLIMMWRAEGVLIIDMVLKLKELGYSCHRQTVRFVIRRYEKKWNIRDWQKNQMTSNRAIPLFPSKE